MNIKQIEKTTEYKNDTAQCTVVASSVAFNMDYKKIHQFYLDNGRKINRGLMPYYTNSIIYKLADLEGYKVTFFKPLYKDDLRKWTSGIEVWNRGFRNYSDFEPDNKEILCRINKHLTPNNQNQYLPRANYILGVRGHVIGVKNGVVNDWTQGRKHQVNKIWRIEKTGQKSKSQKVKRQTFDDAYNDIMNFKF
tara:strand:+ start:2012 stop:2590 length:579 start_codon:yes stop_codon:yes gene_type:complete